ncbi:MAG TPA: hypothetical protein VN684_07545 [Terriglobales bacterium]|nr:hypothetical protein [Terriglobales bacterium]
MRKTLLCITTALVLLLPSAHAQIFSPYLMGGLNLTRNMGYHPTAALGGGGFQTETSHFLATFESFADDSQKLDSGTGWTARMRSVAFFRPTKNLFFGGGISYSALWTSPYSKNTWHPRVGGGFDHFSERFSIRGQAEYVLIGTDHFNSVQGPEFNVYVPSPRSHAHWIYRETIGAYRFYPTAGASSVFGTESRFTMMYRF